VTWNITYFLATGEQFVVSTSDEDQVNQLAQLHTTPREEMPLCMRMNTPDGTVEYISFSSIMRLRVQRMDAVVVPQSGLLVPRSQ
jgi:hypothetical protein